MKNKIINLTLLALAICSSNLSFSMENNSPTDEAIVQSAEEAKVILKSRTGTEFEIDQGIAIISEFLTTYLSNNLNSKDFDISIGLTLNASIEELETLINCLKFATDKSPKFQESEFLSANGFSDELLAKIKEILDYMLIDSKYLINYFNNYIKKHVKIDLENDNKLNIQALFDFCNDSKKLLFGFAGRFASLSEYSHSKEFLENYIKNLNISDEAKVVIAKIYFVHSIIANNKTFRESIERAYIKHQGFPNEAEYLIEYNLIRPLEIGIDYDFTIQELIDLGIFKYIRCKTYGIFDNEKYLDLRFLNISSLAGLQNIPNFKDITFIDLSFNKICKINPEELQNCEHLKILRLRNNNLININVEAFENITETVINLSGNRISRDNINQLEELFPNVVISDSYHVING